MKAWTVLGIIKDGEFVCEHCLKGQDEHDSFNDNGGEHTPIFASDADGSEVCGRCNEPLSE